MQMKIQEPCQHPVALPCMQVEGPYSINFPDEAAPGADLILIGTGTGIAPLIGLLHARIRRSMLLSTECTHMTYLVLVCRSQHDLVMLESIPCRVPGLSIIVYYTEEENEENLRALASTALERRQNISFQHSKAYPSEGAHGHVLIFQSTVLLAALVGIWFGVAIAQGVISNWGKNPEVFLSKKQKKMNMQMAFSAPSPWQYDWLQGITMIFFVNATSFACSFGAGAAFDYLWTRLSDSSAQDSCVSESSDSDTEDNLILRRDSEGDTGRLLGDATLEMNLDSFSSRDTFEQSTEITISDDDLGAELSIRQGRPDIRRLLTECNEVCGRRQGRSFEDGNGVPLPLYVCASGHTSLVDDTKCACDAMRREILHAANRQRIIFTEVSFDMSAI